jgi:hypothetical protein
MKIVPYKLIIARIIEELERLEMTMGELREKMKKWVKNCKKPKKL